MILSLNRGVSDFKTLLDESNYDVEEFKCPSNLSPKLR